LGQEYKVEGGSKGRREGADKRWKTKEVGGRWKGGSGEQWGGKGGKEGGEEGGDSGRGNEKVLAEALK